MPVPTVDRARVLAWRLSAHGLDQRLPESRGTEAVRPAGLRDAVPDAASVGWHARAEGVTSGALRSALVQRRWVKAPTVRGTRVLDPRDLPTLTAGALPADEQDLRDRLRRRATAAAGPARELLEQGIAAAHAAFEAGPRTQAELSQAITAALPAGAAAWCPGCRAVHVDQGLFGLVGLALGWLRAEGLAEGAFVRPDQWLTEPPSADRSAAAAALLDWHLRAHSPTDPAELASFLGVGTAEAARRWAGGRELAEVGHAGRRCWVPVADLDGLMTARPAEGVRLLPPYDAALDGPDRATLVPDPALRREVWRVTANPGVALVDGAVSCAWRARKKGSRLDVDLIPLDGWRAVHREPMQRELAVVAGLRGADLGRVSGP